jgi:hypothetical protein
LDIPGLIPEIGVDALHTAVSRNEGNRIRCYAVFVGVDAAQSGVTALWRAVESCASASVIARLLFLGADVNAARSLDGETALERAMSSGHRECAELLYRCKSDPGKLGRGEQDELGRMRVSRTWKLLQMFKDFLRTSRDVFDGIWDLPLGRLYATPPRFATVTFGQAYVLRLDLALSEELSRGSSGDEPISKLSLWDVDSFGVMGLAPFRSPLANVDLEDHVMNGQLKLWERRCDNEGVIGEYARRANAALAVSSGAGRRDLIHAGGGVKPACAQAFAASMWANGYYSLYEAPRGVSEIVARCEASAPIEVVAGLRNELVIETFAGTIAIGDKTSGMSRGNFFNVTLSGDTPVKFMQKSHPRLAMPFPPHGTGLGAKESFDGSALLHDLCLTSWPDGLDFIVPRVVELIGYGGRAMMGAAWHVPGALRIIVHLTAGFTEFARQPGASVAEIPRALVREGVMSTVPVLFGFRDVGVENPENWGEVEADGKKLPHIVDMFQNVQANAQGTLYVRAQMFESWSQRDFHMKISAQLCAVVDQSIQKDPTAWVAAQEAARSSIAELRALTGEQDQQVLEACAEFLLSDPQMRKVDKILALSLAELCGRLAELEPAGLLVFNQPSDSLTQLVQLARLPAPKSAFATALPIDFQRSSVGERTCVIAGLGGRELAPLAADTPVLPALIAPAGTAANVVDQLRLLGAARVLRRVVGQAGPPLDERQLAIARKVDAALSALCAEFLALTSDEKRRVVIGGVERTLAEAGWIRSWVPVKGEDQINNADRARGVLCGYRERTWQATCWMLRTAKELGVVFS